MSESLRSKFLKLRFNFFPAYRRCGARITYVSSDLHHVKIKLLLKNSNKSHHGGIWGGSLYGAIDPVYTIMLSVILGRNYRVLDKSANIKFKKQGKSTLYGEFIINKEDVENIKSTCASEGRAEINYQACLVDDSGHVHVEADKLIHIKYNKNL